MVVVSLAQRLSDRKQVFIVEFKPDDPNLLPLVAKVKKYTDIVRLTALKNARDPENSGRTPEDVCLESAIKLRRAQRVDAIASLVCRDHPKDDMRVLLRLKEASVLNLLVLYGDPNDPPRPNYYNFKSSVELLRWIRTQESSFEEHRGVFSLVVGSDPTSTDVGKQITGLAEKVGAGANVTITQPVFDAAQGLTFIDAIRAAGLNIPVVVGLLALKSIRSAEFLERRTGVTIPAGVKEMMRNKGVEEGLEIAYQVYSSLNGKADGFYIYPWADSDLNVTLSLLDRAQTR
jgi:methylenetetrahydrofolate reductase (NADPH)